MLKTMMNDTPTQERTIPMKNKPAPVEIELPDNIPGMIIEPLEVPEREIPEDWDI